MVYNGICKITLVKKNRAMKTHTCITSGSGGSLNLRYVKLSAYWVRLQGRVDSHPTKLVTKCWDYFMKTKGFGWTAQQIS